MTGSPALAYRDDGPVAWLAGLSGLVGLAPRRWRGRSFALLLTVAGVAAPLAALPLAALSLATPALSPAWPPLAGAAWCSVVAGLVAGHRHPGRLDWLVSPLLRATEYAFIAVLGFAGRAPAALTFALLCAAVYHHYDVVYRVRQGMPPPAWLSRAGLGWDGRMLVAAAAAAAGAVTSVYAVLAVALWVLFAGESVRTWLGHTAGRREAAAAGTAQLDVEGEVT